MAARSGSRRVLIPRYSPDWSRRSMEAARDHGAGRREDLSGVWHHRHATRLRRLEHHGARRVEAGPILGRHFCLSRPPREPRKNFVLGRPGLLSVREAIGKGPFHMAVYERGLSYADPGATIDALGRARVEGTTADLGPDTGGIRRALRRHDSTQLGGEADKPRTCRSRPISCPTTSPS